MEDRHKTQLRRERLFLTEHLQPILDGLIDRLVLTDTLTDNMKQEIVGIPCQFLIRPNKKISLFRETGLKILGRVSTHIFFLWKFFFMHFERHFLFQNA